MRIYLLAICRAIQEALVDNKVDLDQQGHQEAPDHQVLWAPPVHQDHWAHRVLLVFQEPQLRTETILSLKAHSLKKKSKLRISLVLMGQLKHSMPGWRKEIPTTLTATIICFSLKP
jgi:hypothetical protein